MSGRGQPRVLLIAVLVAGALVAGQAPAGGQEADEEDARALYRKGLGHYNLAEYDRAVTAWKEAYRLSSAPMLLFNIGQAYRLAGDCAQAMQFYDRYRRAEPKPKNPEELAAASEKCRAALAEGEGGADPQPPEAAPEPEPASEPEPAQESAPRTAPPSPATRRGERAVTTRAAAAEPARHGGRGLRLAGAASAAAGVALAGAGVYFALDSASASDDIDAGRGEWSEELRETEARGRRAERLAIALGAGGAAALVAGGVLYYLGVREDRRQVQPLALVPLASGAAVTLGGEF